MKIADAHDGDIVQIGGVQYRLMIKQKTGYLCRHRDEPEDEWSTEHTWLRDCESIDSIVLEQPRRNPRARKTSSKDDLQDPLQWKGTIK